MASQSTFRATVPTRLLGEEALVAGEVAKKEPGEYAAATAATRKGLPRVMENFPPLLVAKEAVLRSTWRRPRLPTSMAGLPCSPTVVRSNAPLERIQR
jgi:hypothetical protein